MMELAQAVLNEAAQPLTARVAAIDLDHLRRMTLGNRDVEIEVLRLFSVQARSLLTELHASGGEMTPMSVHTIKGSALGIGANAVAQAALAVERAGDPAQTRAAVSQLARSLDDVRFEIARLIEIL
jgi:HPt (histidine-containing phosphotransfer) domain-containing protein